MKEPERDSVPADRPQSSPPSTCTSTKTNVTKNLSRVREVRTSWSVSVWMILRFPRQRRANNARPVFLGKNIRCSPLLPAFHLRCSCLVCFQLDFLSSLDDKIYGYMSSPRVSLRTVYYTYRLPSLDCACSELVRQTSIHFYVYLRFCGDSPVVRWVGGQENRLNEQMDNRT